MEKVRKTNYTDSCSRSLLLIKILFIQKGLSPLARAGKLSDFQLSTNRAMMNNKYNE